MSLSGTLRWQAASKRLTPFGAAKMRKTLGFKLIGSPVYLGYDRWVDPHRVQTSPLAFCPG
jgi:hypothetical protein